MRAILLLAPILAPVAFWATLSTAETHIVCYYDSSSHERASLKQLRPALQYCTHLVYGYASITPYTHEITDVIVNIDLIALKRLYPCLKVLLSVGGDKAIDPDHPNKYMELLEGDQVHQEAFISSARTVLTTYGFDGLDLAFQFPKNKAHKVHSKSSMRRKKFKKVFTGDHVVDKKATEHKQQFTNFVRNIRNIIPPQISLLTLTVLPNVNSTWYFDIPTISPYLDFVNLAAFDFLTPERNPEEADYAAPIYDPYRPNRLGHYNLNFQVKFWLQHQCPANKINVGLATYGRAWKMTKESGHTGVPVIPSTNGPAPAGPFTRTAGLLSWPEICDKLLNPSNRHLKGAAAPLHRVSDPKGRYSPYAYRLPGKHGRNGIWVSYEDPKSAAHKSVYAHSKGLGGMAIFDLNFDDFQGRCTGVKYPILRAAQHYLL